MTLPAATELPTLPTTECSHCGTVVPASGFCGACGAHLVRSGVGASQRLHSYAAFPDEPVVRLSGTSALFPHLSHRAKSPFRVGLSAIVVLLVVFSLAGAAAPLIAVCALGIPLLFVLYLVEVDPYESSFLIPTEISLVIGAGLGVGWALLAGPHVQQALLPSQSSSLTDGRALGAAVLVPAIAQILMCVPLVAVRLSQRAPMESLDGFAAGSTGALGFTFASTITLLVPWLGSGQILQQPITTSLAQVLSRGVVWPLVSALVTGLIGAAWCVTVGSRRTGARGKWMTSPLLAVVVALVVQIGLGFAALATLPVVTLVIAELLAVGTVIIVVRIVLHHVLLHEAHDAAIGPPRICPHCSHLVPTMPFCPNCGIADRAVPRRSRGPAVAVPALTSGPAPEGGPADSVSTPTWPTAPPGSSGPFGFPEVPRPEQRGHGLGHLRVIVALAVGLSALTLFLVVAVALNEPAPPPHCAPFKCQEPPLGNPFDDAAESPVVSGTLYQNPQGFSLRYYPSTTPLSGVANATFGSATGVQLSYTFPADAGGGQGLLMVFGAPAGSATLSTMVQSMVNSIAPGAQPVYQLPGALIGYQIGLGEAYDYQPVSSTGPATTDRVIVMAAIKNGFGIWVVAAGPLLPNVTPGTTFWNGHWSPADVNVAYVADKTVNSILFPSS